MTVLIEALSVVIRCEAIAQSYAGGTKVFASEVPNGTLCADGTLAVVRFMTPTDVKAYAGHLEQKGLKHKQEGKAADFVVVDQRSGFCSPCEWATFGHTNWNNDPACPVAVCTTDPTGKSKVTVPNNWTYETSLSSNYKYIDSKEIPATLKLVRTEGNTDILYDEDSGQNFYVKRS